MTERARRADSVRTGPHITERSFGWNVVIGCFVSLLLAALALTPTWIARHGGGTAGTFTATREDCHRKGCTLLGDFHASDGSEVLRNVPIDGSIHKPAMGSPVAAREVFGGVYADPVSLTRCVGFYGAIVCIVIWLAFATIWVIHRRVDRRRTVHSARASRSPTLTRTRVRTRIGPPLGPAASLDSGGRALP